MGHPGTRDPGTQARGTAAGQGAWGHRHWDQSVLRRGCPWRLVPHDVSQWRTVSLSVREGKQAGIGEQAHAVLRRHLRVAGGRAAEPRAALPDRPSVTTRAVRGETRGSDGGNIIVGRTRHLLVETLGLLIAGAVRKASLGDREGRRSRAAPDADRNTASPSRELGGEWVCWGALHTMGHAVPWRSSRDRHTPVDRPPWGVGTRGSTHRWGHDPAHRVSSPSQQMGRSTNECPDHAHPSAFPRW